MIEGIEREILSKQGRRKARAKGLNPLEVVRFGAPPINWNWAVTSMLTDGLEEMIVCDVYRCSTEQLRSGLVNVDPRIRDRIGKLFAENKMMVAELELGGMRYGRQA